MSDEPGTNGSGRLPSLDELALRQKARAVIEAGRLPHRRPDGTWAGPGADDECAICGIPVHRNEMEFEIEFARDGSEPAVDRYHIHTRCFAAWELERHSAK